MKTLNRFSKLPLKNNKLLKNRVVVPPMASQTATPLGFVTDATLAHYARLSTAQPGLLMVEYTYAHESGRSEVHQLGIQSDQHLVGLKKLASLIQNSGALAGLQLSHGGGKTNRNLTGGILMGPSAIAVPVKGEQLETPEAMSLKDIFLWKKSFLEASERAVKAGFDLVEFHAAHGYGLNQWLSPLTNQLQDSYGCDLTGRQKLLTEIIQSVRAKFPDLLLSVRMPGQDFLENGLRIQDTIQIAKNLESAGVDILSISSGIGGWRRPTSRNGEGYLVEEAAQIQKHVSIPVIGVGGIANANYIDSALKDRSFSLAAVGRAILSAPEVWARDQMSSANCEMH